jgi:methyl-accepting chemotaxis protein
MANKNIRDIVVKVSGKDIATAATESKRLNENLNEVIQTVRGSGRNFKSINSALSSLSESMKTINSSMSASKIKTKGLETYQKRMLEIEKTLKSVNATASATAASLGTINKATSSNAANEVGRLEESFQSLEKRINIAIVQLREIVENTGKTANRMKQTREVTKQTGETFVEYSKRVDKAKQSQDSFNNSARGLSGQGRNQKRAFSELAFSMNPLTSLYASIAINVYALSEAFRVLNEASNFDRLLSQTASFSASVSGINVRGLANDMSELSGGILSVRESMQFAIKGAAFNFTAEQLESLTVGARKASIALGRDFTDSMDRVLRGISKQEIELFDELGVVTRLTPAFTAYAVSIGKTVEELSDYERQLALTIEVDNQLQEKFKGIDNQVTAWETLGVTVKNTVDRMLIGVSKVAAPLAKWATELLQVSTASEGLVVATENLTESQEIFALAMEGDHLGNALVAYSQIMTASEELASASGDMSESVKTAAERTETLTTVLQVAAAAATYFAVKPIAGILIPALWSMVKAAYAAGVSVGRFYLALRAINFGAISSGLIAIAGGFATLTTGIRAATVAMLTNPLFWIIGAAVGAAGLAAFALFGDEIKELSSSIMEMIPGLDSSSEALLKQKQATTAATEGYKEMTKQLTDLGVNLSGLSSKEIAEMGAAIKANETTLEEAAAGIQQFSTNANQAKGPFADLLVEINRLANVSASIKDIPQIAEKNAEKFKEVAKQIGLIDKSITNFDELRDALERTNVKARDLAFNLAYAANSSTLFADDPLDEINAQLALQNSLLKGLKAETILNEEAIRLKQQEIDLLNQRKAIEIDREKVTKANFKNALTQFNFEKSTMGVFTTKVDLLENQIEQQNELNAALQLSTTIGVEEKALSTQKLLLLQQELTYQRKLVKLKEDLRKADLVDFITNSENAQARAMESLGGRRLNQEDVASRNYDSADTAKKVAEANLALGEFSGISAEEKQRLRQEVENASNEKVIADIKNQAAAYRELQSSIESVAGSVPGLTSLQDQFIGMSATIAETVANTTELIASGQELTLADFSSSIIAVGSMASAMFSEMTKGTITDIDNQIAAEQKRDGKSKESLEKIKALEKKKIKEQEKSKIVQTAMSTSLAIMKTMAEVPFPGNLAMSAAIGAMGVMQINNIKKAASGQIAALDSGGAGLSLSVGSRNNSVDVSKAASGGELSYLRGESGTGTGSNGFIPGRSGGGSVMVGERGPERITPTQPINVQPASETSKEQKPTVNQNISLNIQALDSQSIEDRSDDIWMALERAANERGYTLSSLS